MPAPRSNGRTRTTCCSTADAPDREPGDRREEPIPSERELVERFGVGRSSVREALRVLESKGLIDQRGKGPLRRAGAADRSNSSLQVLLELQEVDAHELFEVREVLEGETRPSPRAAHRRGHPRDRRGDRRDGGGPHSAEQYIDADLQFHLAIARASRNRIALHMMHAIREILVAADCPLRGPGGPSARSPTTGGSSPAIIAATAAQPASGCGAPALVSAEADKNAG